MRMCYQWKTGMMMLLAGMMTCALTACGPIKQATLKDGSLVAIHLPAPRTSGGMPLMDALRNRQSKRAYLSKPLKKQVLSDLLWAAFGINRPESGRRTAPSALNWQETDIYVFTNTGAYLYDAKANILHPVAAGDFRGETGTLIQPYSKTAPVNLVYVVDADKTGLVGKVISNSERDMYSAAAVGFISQNVYLYCASAGLSTVVRGLVNRDAVRARLHLRPSQKIVLAQCVAYPADAEKTTGLSLKNIKDGQYPGEAFYENQVYRVMVTVRDHCIQDVDIVDICTNTFPRKQITLDALAAGKHVLSEKPFARTLADALKIVETAQ